MKYEGPWWALRCYFPENHLTAVRHRQTGYVQHARLMPPMYLGPNYVGMCFPAKYYPTEEHLPTYRKEIPIWEKPAGVKPASVEGDYDK